MCSIILLRRPGHPWPLVIAANRDEMAGRPWLPPARHWPERAEVVAGLDQLAGGSWFGLNDARVAAAVLNRQGTLGPVAGRRSRGELVLEALDHADAAAAAAALAHLDARAWRPFNLVVADDRDAYVVQHRGSGPRVAVTPLPPGLTMITALEADDPADPRIRRFRPRFAAAPPPEPAEGRWDAWQALLGSAAVDASESPTAAMCFQLPSGFGTRSGTLLALPDQRRGGERPRWLTTLGPPDVAPWQEVALVGGGQLG